MNNERINSGGGSYSGSCSKRGTGFCGCGGGQCGMEKSTAPTARDAGTIDTSLFRDRLYTWQQKSVLMDPALGKAKIDKAYADLVAHIDKHVAAAVAELVRGRDAARRSADAWHQTARAAEADLAKLRSTAPTNTAPLAWIRCHPDGSFSNDVLLDHQIEPVRKNSGAWAALGVIAQVPQARAATAPVSAAPLDDFTARQKFLEWNRAFDDEPVRVGVEYAVFDKAVELARATLPQSTGAPMLPDNWEVRQAANAKRAPSQNLLSDAAVGEVMNALRSLMRDRAGAPVSGAEQLTVRGEPADPAPVYKWGADGRPTLTNADKMPIYADLRQTQAETADGQELPAHEDFAVWLAREMPAGTVIADPAWWAPRILRAALAMRQPQGDEDGAKWRQILAAVVRELPKRGHDARNGNAPGHGHDKPGIWDGDNGILAGKECAWCKTWNLAVSELAAKQAGKEA